MPSRPRLVDVYPYRKNADLVQFLLLRRAPGRLYAGQWRMVGGKIDAGETAWQAALRELREETGLDPSVAWTIPSANVFYEWQHDHLHTIPAFAAEVAGHPVLDDEHDAFDWVPVEGAVARLGWPEQQRLVSLVATLLERGIPSELVLPIART